jgi:hypothetical protein
MARPGREPVGGAAIDAQMRRSGLLIFAFMLAAALLATAAHAERRIALVIGNSAYRNAAPLPNTINDANAIAALFRSVGFEVVSSRTELGVLEFKRAVRDFLITAETADIAVVYYAGHGIEVAGANYLIPVDAKLARDYDVEDEAVALDRIIWALQPVKRLRLILLDACRDNPFAARLQRSVGIRAAPKGGLAKIDDVSADTLVAYAAKEGSVSYDGAGANSPFASALLKHLAEPGLDVRIALGRVRDDVLKTTAGRQEPFIYGSLGGSIIPLVPQGKVIEPKPIPEPAVAVREPPPLRPNAAAAPTRPGPSEPQQSKLPAAVEKEDSASACSRDEQRLARLRSDPVPEEIARFQRELTCVRLRAQVQRLYESVLAEQPASSAALGGGPAKPAGKAEPGYDGGPRQQAQAPPLEQPQNVCARDAERLARLRAEPTLDAITRFERELGCEQIRPQVRRLRESVGQ